MQTTARERQTYRDFADTSGGDFSDIIHDLCHDADEAQRLRDGIRALACDTSGCGYIVGDDISRELRTLLGEDGE